MTFGSLFAGIGGFDLGFERAGMRCVWQVEIDPYCRRVLAKHWPDVPKWDDVKTFTGDGFERPDVICGGFPCQDISNAGKRAGIDGERSGLWSEYCRIVRLLRPRFVVVENVSALLARGLDRVVGDLAESGYDAEWDCIPAAAVGAPHRRDRLFLVAHAAGVSGPDGAIGNRRIGVGAIAGPSGRTGRGNYAAGVGDDRRPAGVVEKTVAHADDAGLEGRDGEVVRERAGKRTARSGGSPVPDATGSGLQGRIFQFGVRRTPNWNGRGKLGGSDSTADAWQSEPDVGRVANGVPARVDRLKGLGNAVVPQVAEWIGRRLLVAGNLP